jgi:hypothetical protein
MVAMLGHELIDIADGLEDGFNGDIEDALNVIWGHGIADDEVAIEDGIDGVRVANWILWTDEQGFTEVVEYPTEEAACVALEAIRT